jgi:hypothetical protein
MATSEPATTGRAPDEGRHQVVIEGWARAFLERPRRFGVIATRDRSGAPLQAVVWYALREGGILLNSRVGRRWPTNLLRDPRASLLVADRYRYVCVVGLAERLYVGDRALADIGALARAYLDAEEAERVVREEFSGQRRISFLLSPQAVVTHR